MSHLGNANKKASKTPRTDRQAYITWDFKQFVKAGFARQLERQLAGANQRIKELKKENDAMHHNLFPWQQAGIGFTAKAKP